MTPISLMHVISKTACDRNSVKWGTYGKWYYAVLNGHVTDDVTQIGQNRDLVIFRCKYLKNGLS